MYSNKRTHNSYCGSLFTTFDSFLVRFVKIRCVCVCCARVLFCFLCVFFFPFFAAFLNLLWKCFTQTQIHSSRAKDKISEHACVCIRVFVECRSRGKWKRNKKKSQHELEHGWENLRRNYLCGGGGVQESRKHILDFVEEAFSDVYTYLCVRDKTANTIHAQNAMHNISHTHTFQDQMRVFVQENIQRKSYRTNGIDR